MPHRAMGRSKKRAHTSQRAVPGLGGLSVVTPDDAAGSSPLPERGKGQGRLPRSLRLLETLRFPLRSFTEHLLWARVL